MNNIKFSYNASSSMPFYIQFLSYKLDNFRTQYKCGISIYELENLLGDEINELLNDKNKPYILSKWKYGNYFRLTEEAHADGYVLFGNNKTWNQSFILGLLMYSFH
jgi:hypothetical protein